MIRPMDCGSAGGAGNQHDNLPITPVIPTGPAHAAAPLADDGAARREGHTDMSDAIMSDAVMSDAVVDGLASDVRSDRALDGVLAGLFDEAGRFGEVDWSARRAAVTAMLPARASEASDVGRGADGQAIPFRQDLTRRPSGVRVAHTRGAGTWLQSARFQRWATAASVGLAALVMLGVVGNSGGGRNGAGPGDPGGEVLGRNSGPNAVPAGAAQDTNTTTSPVGGFDRGTSRGSGNPDGGTDNLTEEQRRELARLDRRRQADAPRQSPADDAATGNRNEPSAPGGTTGGRRGPPLVSNAEYRFHTPAGNGNLIGEGSFLLYCPVDESKP